MGILEALLNSDNGRLLKQMAGNFGVPEGDAKNAVAKMLPALSRGMKNNISQPGGLEGLMGALMKGNHTRYVDSPEMLNRPETISDGNAILGHLLGSKDVSRRVASDAASQTGVDAGVLKKMLPVIATMMMGTLGKQSSSSGLSGLSTGGRSDPGLAGMLSSFLDTDKDGSIVDDVLGMAKKLF